MQELGMWWDLGMAFAAGLSGSLLIFAGLARKVYNLQLDLSTVQEQLLREKNQRAALTRHRDKESLEVLNSLKAPAPLPVPHNALGKFGIGR